MWAGVGKSKLSDALKAGQAAALEALGEMRGTLPDVVFVFACTSYNQEKIIQGVKSVTGETPLVGASCAGQITTEGPDKASVVVMVIKSKKLKVGLGLGENITKNAREAGYSAARQAGLVFSKHTGLTYENPRRVFIMFPDGVKGNGADIIRGCQEVLGTSFPIVGGSAGDNFLFQKSFQYLQDKVYTEAVAGVLLGGDIDIGIGAKHGWRALGKTRTVTSSFSNVIREIDNQPAINIYKEYFEEETRELETRPLSRMAILYPLGMAIPEEEEYLVRNPFKVGENGSLICGAEVPEGSKVRLMIGNKDTCLAAAKDAAWQAKRNIKATSIKFVIIFSSISRDKLLGRNNLREVEIVKTIIGKNVPIIGFYTYGEQAPLKAEVNIGQAYFHNESIVILAVGE